MAFDNAYEAITEDNDDGRWAFGTGFADPLAGLDTAVPDGVDAAALAAYCLALADDAVIMSHRLQELVTRAPELEEELALANIALDLLGQARLLYTRAGQADGTGRTEDAYAFLRDAAEFRNVRLAELPGGDFAFEMARLLVFATWRLALLEALTAAPDPVLAAIAAKAVKELAYHRDHAAQWVVRLGDGTDLSRTRMRTALDQIRPYVAELLTPTAQGRHLGVDLAALQPDITAVLHQVLQAATLDPALLAIPTPPPPQEPRPTRALVELVGEMQSVARADREAVW
jgi:ring-1,2-phenylacetyl-CoA epoxidase subunit PaaC